MDGVQSHTAGGSLHISSEVIEKIAKHATMEIEGVAAITVGTSGAKSLLDKIAPQNPVRVEMNDEVADIEISLSVFYGTKVPEICENVQKNVKSSVQNMTNISVAKVDIIVTGVVIEAPHN